MHVLQRLFLINNSKNNIIIKIWILDEIDHETVEIDNYGKAV